MGDKHKEILLRFLKSVNCIDEASYIDRIILYGSCARGTENENSDIDLFVVFKDTTSDEYAQHTLDYLGYDMPFWDNWHYWEPKFDVHGFTGNFWEDLKDIYYINIREEGITIWEQGEITLA